MSASRRSVIVFSVLAALLMAASVSASQRSHNLLIIRVLDPTGNPVPDAQVITSTRDSRVRSSGTTSHDGTLQLDVLAADYVVEVSAPGFAAVTRIITVNAPRTSVDVRLPIAALAEHVIVTASGDQQAALEVSKALVGSLRTWAAARGTSASATAPVWRTRAQRDSTPTMTLGIRAVRDGRADVRVSTSAQATLRAYVSDAFSAINESPAPIATR